MVDYDALAHAVRHHDVDLRWQRAFYEDLHAHPELSQQEEETAARILAGLDGVEGEVFSGIGSHGIVVILRNGEGPCVLFRADFDALPVHEQTGVLYASTRTATDRAGRTQPVMHACGHDMHTTALMGLVHVLDQRRDLWSGTFIGLFQPSEENGQGALAMIDDGLLDLLPRPDVCLGQHIMPGPAGTVHTMPGAQFATCDSIRITIPGRSSHGSMPHKAIDPTFVAAMIIVRLQGIVGREVDPNDFAVVSVGTLRAGTANNIIPESAELVLNCRFYDTDVRTRVYAAIRRVVEAECLASGCPRAAEIEFFDHGEMIDNDPETFAFVRPAFDTVFGEDSVDARRVTPSEDFANLPKAWGVPYLYWVVGCTPREQWAEAAAADRIDQDIPVNHQGTFLPDPEPTTYATTHAALAAVLSYLHRS